MKRRDILKQGMAAIGGAAAVAAGGTTPVDAQTTPARGTATPPARRSFRAFIRTDAGASVQEVRMLPLRDNMVVVKTEATQCCYTIVNQALGTGQAGGAGGAVKARILGHGGAGVVDAVGRDPRAAGRPRRDHQYPAVR
jgi:hypothetical protein